MRASSRSRGPAAAWDRALGLAPSAASRMKRAGVRPERRAHSVISRSSSGWKRISFVAVRRSMACSAGWKRRDAAFLSTSTSHWDERFWAVAHRTPSTCSTPAFGLASHQHSRHVPLYKGIVPHGAQRARGDRAQGLHRRVLRKAAQRVIALCQRTAGAKRN